MLRGTRSTATLVASLLVATGALAGCAGGTPGTGLTFGDGLDALTITGDIDAAKLEFKERMSATDLKVDTVVTGDGAALKDDDKVYVNFLVGNGYTRQTTIDSFGDDPGVQFTVGAPNTTPTSLSDIVGNLLAEQVKAGATRDSRIVLTGSTETLFGDLVLSRPDILAAEGIGNDDGLVVVADLLDVTPLGGPDGTEAPKVATWAPGVVSTGDVVTGLDFSQLEQPAGKAPAKAFTLIKGTGAEIAEGDLLTLDYLATSFKAEKPFDETYSADKQPVSAPVGLFLTPFTDATGNPIPLPGLADALEGQTVGSRVLVRVPPGTGFGATPPEGSDVKANATLYYVVDILAAI